MKASPSELKRWYNRIWRPDIKYEGSKENKKLDGLYGQTEMCNVCFESKEDLYKFLDYGIDSGIIRNNDVDFVRGDVFDVYVITDYRTVDTCYEYIKEMIADNFPNTMNKWLVCEALNKEFDFYSAGYFISKLRKDGCRGILYHIEDDSTVNNFYECSSKKNYCKNIFIPKGQVEKEEEKNE